MNDAPFRRAAFDWLAAQAERYGEVLPRTLLADGFDCREERIRIVGPQGIFKPRAMQLPLSITTSPNSPYNDAFGEDHLLRYRYRGSDPSHPDNAGLRQAMKERAPLVYLHGLMPGRYLPVWAGVRGARRAGPIDVHHRGRRRNLCQHPARQGTWDRRPACCRNRRANAVSFLPDRGRAGACSSRTVSRAGAASLSGTMRVLQPAP